MSKILKNTVYLYVRMIIVLAVSLYTSRIILNSLGIVDYGIYNLVSGIVVSFSFITTTLSNTSMRYYSIELGLCNKDALTRLFNINFHLYFILSIIFIFAVELVGIYMVNNILDIPVDRLTTAKVLLQFSILTCVLQIMQTPFVSAMIATEKMSIYGYIGIVEAAGKLFISFLLLYTSSDRLIFYGGSLFVMSLIIFFIYYVYSIRNIDFCEFRGVKDITLLKNIVSFSGWSLLESLADIFSIQGINILLNVFIGIVVNAAAGVANQVTSLVWSFVSNFQTAFKPQITKFYSQGDKDGYTRLMFQSSKLSFFLYFVLVLPLFINLPILFELWLVEVPPFAIGISRIVLVNLILGTLAVPIHVLVQAKGQVKEYQIRVTSIMLLTLPFSYIVLKYGLSPYWVFAGRGCVSLLAHVSRVLFLKKEIGVSSSLYIGKVIFPMLLSAIIAIIPTYIIYIVTDGYTQLFTSSLASLLFSTTIFYLLGLDEIERNYVKSIIKKFVRI